jgi:hypothetical protein
LDLPEALSEMEALQQVRELASANESAKTWLVFWVPALIITTHRPL